MKTKYYFHIHHEVLVETLTEFLKNRIKYIKENKPKDEIELRLRLIKPVKGKLPSKFVKANQAWIKAYRALVKAYQDNIPAFEKLHKKECGCGWSSERSTIFTKVNGLEK